MSHASLSTAFFGERTPSSLLSRAQARDEAAWVRLVDLYAPLVYGWCRRAGLQEADAADVGQDVFLAVQKAIGTFHKDAPNSTFRGWLRVITRNKLNDFLRKGSHKLKPLEGPEVDRVLEHWDESSVNDESDERRIVLRQALDIVLTRCSSTTRQAFLMHVVEDKSASEVAQALGISCDKVYLTKSRLIRRLRDELEGLIDL